MLVNPTWLICQQKHQQEGKPKMGERTKLNKSTPKSQSLRTTIPFSIIQQFGLTEYDELEWSLKAVSEGKLIMEVTPIKTGRTE